MGCAPYLQIFKAGKLVFTTAATLHFHQSQEELPFVQVVDGPVPFHVEQIIQGDILIRCRHLTFQKQRVSMFRSAFHTGYAPPNVMRLTKAQLDGACSDKRFRDDFFLDLIFEKVDAVTATKHLEEEAAADHAAAAGDGAKSDGDDEKKGGGKGPVIKASTYDSMLHGDSRFWDVIAARRQEQASQKENDPMWGPTVGRRRGGENKKKTEQDGKAQAPKERTQLETFSIGNEFDFLPEEKDLPAAVAEAPQKDDLMDALNALDEGEDAGTEQIVFDTISEPVKSYTSPQPTVVGIPPADGDSSKDNGKPEETTTETMTFSETEPTKSADEESTSVKPEIASIDDDLDDMDALMATADEDLGDFDLDDFDDDDDDDLEDLEKMLTP
jgi:tensin